MLYAVVPQLPTSREQFARSEALFTALDLDYAWPTVDDDPSAEVHALYARGWMMLAERLAADQLTQEAERAQRLAAQLAP